MRPNVLLLLALTALLAIGCEKGKAEAKDDVIPPEELARKIEITEITVGEGEAVDVAYRCMIEYVGRFPGSEVSFDRNDQRNEQGQPTKPPYSVLIGSGTSVKGLEEGLIGMKKGGKRKIFVPWHLAYGTKGTPDGNVPPRSDLEFEVTLLDFVPVNDQYKFDYEDVKVGSGRGVKEGDKVTVHYRATYANGMLFDDSRQRGDKPGGETYTFKIGRQDVIQGMDYGMRGMKVGGIRKIWIPPDLVFGKAGYQTIQGGQIVNIEVQLLAIE